MRRALLYRYQISITNTPLGAYSFSLTAIRYKMNERRTFVVNWHYHGRASRASLGADGVSDGGRVQQERPAMRGGATKGGVSDETARNRRAWQHLSTAGAPCDGAWRSLGAKPAFSFSAPAWRRHTACLGRAQRKSAHGAAAAASITRTWPPGMQYLLAAGAQPSAAAHLTCLSA